MSKRFTYRELTLLLGIAVALIVLFTFWIRQLAPLSQLPNTTTTSFQKVYDSLTETKEQFEQIANGFLVPFSSQNNPY